MELLVFDTEQFDESGYLAAFSAMSQERREKCLRLRSDRARRLCAAADMLARRAVCAVSGIPEASLRFYSDSRGKPYVENAPVFFSVSHSEHFAVCVASESEIGVDVEQLRPLSEDFVRRFSSARELKGLDKEDEYAPIRLWTLKEAYGKTTGEGVFRVLDKTAFVLDGLTVSDGPDGFAFTLREDIPGFSLAVCEKK